MKLLIPNNVFIGPVLKEAGSNGITYVKTGFREYSFQYPANPSKVKALKLIWGLKEVE